MGNSILAISFVLLSSTQAAATGFECAGESGGIRVSEDGVLVLVFSHGTTAVPAGIGPEFARGDYVSALYGLDGELLTEDYPKDHPHHRAVNWSWATIQWNGESRDLFAVRGIWARPEGEAKCDTTGGATVISATSLWKWDDKTPVVRETVTIRVLPKAENGRAIDFDITLQSLVDGLEFCGRLEAAYSGFNVRMAPAAAQKILFHTDPPEAGPRRA
jgi:hypothetical protein